jgi:hypothetical protein
MARNKGRYRLGAERTATMHATVPAADCAAVGQQIAGCDPYDPCGWQMVAGCELDVAPAGTFNVTMEANNGSPYFTGVSIWGWGIATNDCTRNLRFNVTDFARGNERLLSTTGNACYLSDIFLQNTCGPLYFPFGTFSTDGLARQLTITGTNICAENLDVYFVIFGFAQNTCN